MVIGKPHGHDGVHHEAHYDHTMMQYVSRPGSLAHAYPDSADELRARIEAEGKRVDRAIAEQFRMMSDDGLWPRPFDAPQPKLKENSPPTTPPAAVSTPNKSKVLLLCSN